MSPNEEIRPQGKRNNEMDMNNLPDKDFKMLVIMLVESRRIMEGYNEKFNKETENIRKFQTELTVKEYNN